MNAGVVLLALSIPAAHKAIVTGAALVILLTLEHIIPAHPEGKGGWRHDLRNLGLGGANALLVAALFAWVVPLPGEAQGVLRLDGAGPIGATILALLALDLWMYVWHVVLHRVPFLWRFHRMHHTDRAMDASSAVRFHPGEVVMATVGRLPVVWLLGIALEQIVLYEMILLPAILFHHSNVRIPAALDRILRWLVVTPALHRVHHSPVQVETDSNYGSVLSVWDRLGRSFRLAGPVPVPRYGLEGLGEGSAAGLRGMLSLPFRRSPAAPPRTKNG